MKRVKRKGVTQMVEISTSLLSVEKENIYIENIIVTSQNKETDFINI